MIGFLLLAVSLIFLLAASYTDIRTREVPDELSIIYVVAALFLRLAYSLYAGQPAFFLEPLGIMVLFGAFAYGLFLTKQWGGGDLLIFLGIGMSFGTLPDDLRSFFSPILAPWPFWLTLILNLVLVGAIYGTLALLVIVSRRSALQARYFSEMRGFLPVAAAATAIFLVFSFVLQKLSFPSSWQYSCC